MQKITTIVAICAFSITIFLDIACTQSLKISYDYDKATPFTSFRTFNISTVEGAFNEFNQQRIRKSIRQVMTKKGYAEQAVQADLTITATGVAADRRTVTARTDFQNGGLHRYGYWATPALTTVSSTHYKEGTLVIDVIESRSRKLVWQAVGTSELYKQPKNPDKTINKAITRMLEAFPANK